MLFSTLSDQPTICSTRTQELQNIAERNEMKTTIELALRLTFKPVQCKIDQKKIQNVPVAKDKKIVWLSTTWPNLVIYFF